MRQLPFLGTLFSTSAFGSKYKNGTEDSFHITIGSHRTVKHIFLGPLPNKTRRSFSKPTKNMASSLFVLLSLAFIAIAIASPVPTDQSETTAAADKDVALIDVVEVIEPIPVVVPLVDDASTSVPDAKEADHKIAKRSALRGDNPSNDLLADLDGLKYENGLSSFDGRRIKFLPTWLG
ncbi:unnamed protein product [Diatraea saccharalis]|uniref:Uncharacterized protein n=1 Tax=Diatraea saccharalis TaxID=40085 RepID=A0A9N9RDV9_9NEOP|nr:unnamed protein product [Diatraea saccharalis]